MSVNQQAAAENTGQSLGSNPKPSNKRNSGIFTFFKWLKPFTSRESINTDSVTSSSSCESVDSIHSDGTVASFSFIPPSAYKNRLPDKYVPQTPETDTYRARLRQRDNRRENEKNLTLRKKYNLFFNRDTLKARLAEEDSSRSLPLMTKKMEEEEEKMHRRTASESSKVKRAGAYCHVKGKRKAPQPPGAKVLQDGNSTMSLKRKKRLAPSPPEVLCNDSLKLDHGVLKSVKEDKEKKEDGAGALCDTPLSPKPWYKRNPGVSKNKEKTKESRGSDVAAEETKKKEEKRKSGMSFLTNISELDREATEIIQKEYKKASVDDLPEIPEFMRPKQESKINTDSWASPKRKSARDLIAKFNAITNVTKVTVNSAFFGSGKQYFEKQTSLDETKRPPTKLDQFRKKSAEFSTPLMKSESTSAIKPRAERSPKPERENWRCPRCQRENDYWRIICCVCSNIKPYFDELVTNPGKNSVIDQSKTQNAEIKRNQCSVASKNTSALKTAGESPERILERSKTQIGFSALVKYNEGKPKQENADFKKEEKEKLKKMLIEMKNSLPKKKLPLNTKQNSRASVIEENNDENGEDNKENKKEIQEEPKETKSASVVIATTETIYENIKMKRTPDLKPLKVSSSAQTSSVVNKVVVPSASNNKENLETKISVREKNDSSQNQAASCSASENQQKNYQLLRPKDFEGIYSDKLEKTQRAENVYQNLAKNDDLSLFFNVPKRFSEIKKEFDITSANNTDTLEINRLLKRLENAIAKGEMVEASLFARELAQLKVNCSVVRQKSTEDAPKGNGSHFMVEMYVEDKISHRGPFPIKVKPQQTVRELKLQVEKEFEIPVAVQRWILGKELASNDEATLADVRVNTEGCPIFLYLVAPTNDTKSDQESKIEEKPKQEIPKTAPNSKIHEKLHQTSNISPISNQVESTNVKITPRPSTGNSIETGGLLKPSVKNSEKNPNKSDIPEDVPSTSGGISKLNTKSDTATNIKIGSNVEEEPEDYDVKTLKPQCNEWECPRCTLLNPKASNICGACSSIRVRIPKVELERPKRQKGKAPMAKQEEASGGIKEEHYLQLLDLDNADLVENTETFECLVCFLDTPPKAGVTLRECLHQFCKHCLRNTVEYSEEAEVKCPYRDATYSCDIALQDREIKALVPKAVYDQYLAKSVTQAENKIDKSFHCKTPDCKGWCVYEDNANEFRCPICRRINCLTCQAIHTGLNCKQYQERMNAESETDEDAKRTKEMLQEMLNKGEALTCPTCQVILMKKWGCDWLRCSMCKTEICWVTRGPRWGPAGKGDTSGGCQCGVNGVKCHPQCNYCH